MLVAWLFLFLLAAGTAYFAGKKGRSPLGWFMLTLLLGMIAPVLLYFLGEAALPSVQPPTAPLPQPQPLQQPQADWYYLDQNRQPVGPVSTLQLQELCDQGHIAPSTYLWKEGMAAWQKQSECFLMSSDRQSKNQK